MAELIALILLVPVAIVVLLIVNFTRTSSLNHSVALLQEEITRLKAVIAVLARDGTDPNAQGPASVAAPPQPENPSATSATPPPASPTSPAAIIQEPQYQEGDNDVASKNTENVRARPQPANEAAYSAPESDETSQRTDVDKTTFPPIKERAYPEPPAPNDSLRTSAQNTQQQDRGSYKDLSLEDIIGGKLPIWIGGIALIFAAFFLVRYSIEAGLFGPRVRSITAAVFGLLLVGVSQFGEKLPKIGFAFAEDKRIGQSLAGAAVAILYATLYMASELYGLVPLLTAFALVVAISVLAFVLALRHGPPTAIMGVVGGFSAPFVAGMNADNLPLLLSYLGVFMAALFALSLWQRWMWLLLMTVGGGGLWTISLVGTANDGLPLLGLFILAAAAAAIVSALRLDATEDTVADDDNNSNNRWSADLRFDDVAVYLPQIVALLQLCILVPRMEFSPLGWAFLFALGAVSLVLAWRDNRLWPLSGLTALGFLFPIVAGWYNGSGLEQMLVITFGYAALFAGASHGWLALKTARHSGAGRWALMAIMPILIAYLLVVFQYQGPLAFISSGFIGLILALPCAWVAWQFRDDESDGIALPEIIAGVTLIMTGTSLIQILPGDWLAIIGVILAFGLALWGQYIHRRFVKAMAFLPFGGAVLAMLLSQQGAIDQYLSTLVGAYIQHDLLPAPTAIIITVLLPALLMLAAALAPQSNAPPPIRIAFAIAGGVFLALYIFGLTKQPLAINNAEDFVLWGFTERALTTLAIAAIGAAILRFVRGPIRPIGLGLIALGALRFVWFDLLMFNPVLREQAVGAQPVFNMAVLLCAALTGIFWWASKQQLDDNDGLSIARNVSLPWLSNGVRFGYYAALIMAILTVMVAVRQYVHGTIIAYEPVETTENYLYSATLLLLALSWIGYAIFRAAHNSSRTLRQAGLALLTAVTLKVFLVDAAAMEGLLRILSFLGLGVALIVIGWAYRRLLARDRSEQVDAA